MSQTLDSVLEAVNFIEENLQNELSVLAVSEKVCYSIYHFIRLFEGMTGHTPKDYILRRRVSEACKELTGSSKKIIDVCFDYQFGSPEVFTRACKRILGVNPRDITRRDHHSDLPLLFPIGRDSIIHTGIQKGSEPEIITLGDLHLAGMVTFIREDKSIIDELWSYIGREMHQFEEENIRRFYSHSFWSNDYDPDGFFLLCGMELNTIPGPEVPFCSRTIPKNRYLKFIHTGDVSNIRHTYKYIFQTYLPKKDFRLIYPFDFEVYYPADGNPHSPDNRTEILIPIGD